MISDLVPVTLKKIMQSRSYTVIILGDDKKKFAIYVEPRVGQNLQFHLTQEKRPRPLTYDLMHSIFTGFNIKILQVVINDIEDTIYFARLFLELTLGETRQILEIDARPSDCLTLAFMNNVPLFCRREIFEKTLPVEE
jgi:uncharacterized protein